MRLAGQSCTGSPTPTRGRRAALEIVELDPDDRRRLATYSKGMRQRVKVAQALVHDPDVLVLDEPLTGLDPRQRLHMIDLFQRLGAGGRCVLVSSHVLDEVERFGSRILVIAQGRLAAEGDFRAIRDLMDDRPRRFRVRTDRPRTSPPTCSFYGLARRGARSTAPDQLVVDTTDAPRLRRAVAAIARNRQARLCEVAPARRGPRERLPLPGRHRRDERAAPPPVARGRPPAGTWNPLYRLFLGWAGGRARLVGARRGSGWWPSSSGLAVGGQPEADRLEVWVRFANTFGLSLLAPVVALLVALGRARQPRRGRHARLPLAPAGGALRSSPPPPTRPP